MGQLRHPNTIEYKGCYLKDNTAWVSGSVSTSPFVPLFVSVFPHGLFYLFSSRPLCLNSLPRCLRLVAIGPSVTPLLWSTDYLSTYFRSDSAVTVFCFSW